MIFHDRREAGEKLSAALKKYKNNPQAVILALPRGGVIIGATVAKNLELPLDIIVPRKIGAPENPEYAVGAITETGEAVWNEEERARLSQEYIAKVIAEEKKEAERRLKTYLVEKSPLNLREKTAILVDDGIATGLTMLAAIKSARARGAKRLVVAVPVSSEDAAKIIEKEVDEFIALDKPFFFGAVGAFYENFEQVNDEEVVEIMKLET